MEVFKEAVDIVGVDVIPFAKALKDLFDVRHHELEVICGEVRLPQERQETREIYGAVDHRRSGEEDEGSNAEEVDGAVLQGLAIAEGVDLITVGITEDAGIQPSALAQLLLVVIEIKVHFLRTLPM